MSCNIATQNLNPFFTLYRLTQERDRYHNIRLDSVHYCDREVELAAKRKRRSFAGRNRSPPQERLQLLSRTVRENGLLAQKVQYLKLPYMTREESVADLARTIAFMPNLRYVDLPDLLYMDDPSSSMLKQELQSRCPSIRHMRYLHGSESSFQSLIAFGHWRNLEAIELSQLTVDPNSIIDVLASLPALNQVSLANMPSLDDSLFVSESAPVPFPPLTKLSLREIPNISSRGIVAYLSRIEAKMSLASLVLTDTGIPAAELYQILSAATNLTNLHISTNVTRPLVSSEIPLLASQSLRTFHYEISNANTSPNNFASPSESYYAYLSTSVLNGSLPSLNHLYALSDAPQDLLQPPPRPSFLGNRKGTIPRPLSLGITRPLHLYTKAIREMEWNVTLISPPTPSDRRGSTTAAEPESLYHPAPLSPQYRRTGRDSVMVSNGFGGFLAVPSPGLAPGSPQSKNKKKDLDSWMG